MKNKKRRYFANIYFFEFYFRYMYFFFLKIFLKGKYK